MFQASLETPVGLIIFNRPHTTEQVLGAIAQARPRRLMVFADGPRPDRPDDEEKCRQARAIIDRVAWDCDVLRNFSKTNLGCGLGPATAITWFFSQEEEAIILEDDCVPSSSFFTFCREMLTRYRDHHQVMAIAGLNSLQRWKDNFQSYHFSRLGATWGWASWRRAWQHYDYDMKLWPKVRDYRLLYRTLENEDYARVMSSHFAHVFETKDASIWDYQWTFAILLHSGLFVVPARNLIQNVGFGQDATHTKSDAFGLANLAPLTLEPPYVNLGPLVPDLDFDRRLLFRLHGGDSLLGRALRSVLPLGVRKFARRHLVGQGWFPGRTAP